MTPALDCPICGETVHKSHTCKGRRARAPWRNRPDDFAARVERARNAARQSQLPIDDGSQQ